MINSRLTIGLSAVFLCVCNTGCDKVLWGEETKYAPHFSQAKFRSIVKGVSEAEVIDALGVPLNRSTQTWSEVWHYQPIDDEPVGRGGNGADFNLFGEFSQLEFNQSGIVTNAKGHYLKGLLIGLSKEEVIQKHGPPRRQTLREFALILHYSAPGEAGTYKRREVHLGQDGRVIRTENATYYD